MRHQVTIGVFAIIFDDDKRVLLCHRRDYDLWNLPGGGLEKDESPWAGAIREVKEETGLDVEVIRLAGVYSKPEKDEIIFSFICTVVSGKITLSDESDRVEYFEVDKIPSNTVPKQVERIIDAIANPEETILKIQIGPSAIDLVKEGKL